MDNVVNNFVRVTQEHKHIVVKGAGGLQGLPGPAGAGLKIDGSVDTYSDLPHHLTPSDAGVAYFVQADGLLYIWTGERWPEEGQGAQFQGPRGIQGPPGQDGEPGPANTLSIGTVQGGASAAATITGDSPNQTLNLTLPKGDPGEDAYIPDLASFKSALLDVAYPIGTIYTSTNSTSPETFLGGTWVQIKDTFLLTAGDTYTAGATGGEAEHTLTASEIPAHQHTAEMCGITSKGSGASQQGDFYRTAYWNRFQTTGNAVYDYYGTGTLTTKANTGGDQPHNNMPPYLVVYAWERTA